jgi:hypothetical protein
MRDRPLPVVADRLGADVIDGFLDEQKNSNAALWSSSSDKSAEVRETFFQSHFAICPGGKYTNLASTFPRGRPPAM